jgi:excisionase family DNA binding protein
MSTLDLPAQTISVDEAAAILGVERHTAYAGVKRGEIPSIRVGRRIRVPVPALKRMLDGLGITEPTDEQLVGWSLEVNPESGEVNPAQTVGDIAETTGLDVDDVDRALETLMVAGWLKIRDGKIVVDPRPEAAER